MAVTSYPAAAGSIPETEIGSSYATGTSSATIVSSGANTDGVRISTAAIHNARLTSNGSLSVGGNVLMKSAGYNSNSTGAVALSGLLVPAGQEVSFDVSTTDTTYYISYEVL